MRCAGLEVSDRFVRAASAPGRGRPSFGEVRLPVGAVVHGEVVDTEAVAASISELWREASIGTRSVVVGIANQDVVTRQMDLPRLSDKDLRSALHFELADMIPFPVSEAVVDFRRIEDVEDDRGNEQTRVLAVAGLQRGLRDLVRAARAARLRVRGVDLTAMALVRAVANLTPADGETDAIVHLGDDSLTIAVHREGVVRFTRSVMTNLAANETSGELEAELVLLERFRDRAAGGGGGGVVVGRDPLLAAIEGTIEYYAIQPGAVPISRITLVGDQERAAGVASALALATGSTVGLADPLHEEATYQVLPFVHASGTSAYAASYGLALPAGGRVVGPAPLDLLPPDETRRPHRVVLGRALAAGTATAVLLGGVVALAGPDVDGATAEADAKTATVEGLQQRVEGLAAERSAAAERATLQRLGDEVRNIQIDWDQLLAEIRAQVPPGSTLLSLTGRAPTTDATGVAPGSIELTGQAADQAGISSWLDRLATIPGLTDPWLSSASTSAPDAGGQTTFTIMVTVDPGPAQTGADPTADPAEDPTAASAEDPEAGG